MKDFELRSRIAVEVVVFIYICLKIGAFFGGG